MELPRLPYLTDSTLYVQRVSHLRVEFALCPLPEQGIQLPSEELNMLVKLASPGRNCVNAMSFHVEVLVNGHTWTLGRHQESLMVESSPLMTC